MSGQLLIDLLSQFAVGFAMLDRAVSQIQEGALNGLLSLFAPG